MRGALTTFSPAKILVCQLRQIGDVLLATPALELLRKRYPEAAIHVLTEAKCAPLLEYNPNIDRVWALDKKKLTPFWRELAWYWHLTRESFDLVVDFQQLPRCRWVVAFSGASVRLSYPPHWYLRFLYTHTIRPRDGYAAMSKASVLAPLGIEWDGERPSLFLTDAEKVQARARLSHLGLRPEHRLISLDPTHRQLTRRWPLASYAACIAILARRDSSLRFLPLWGPGEEGEIRELIRLAPAEALLLPDTMLSLREMAACIGEASLHIGNCSAPRHIAVAVGTPSCVIRGATSDSWTFPSPDHMTISAGLDCQPCNRNTCPHVRCLTGLTPESVAEKIWKVLVSEGGLK